MCVSHLLFFIKKLINVLKNIEEGDVDQHEGSVVVGKILKEMYIDSALKQEEQRKERDQSKPVKPKGPKHTITWQQFPAME